MAASIDIDTIQGTLGDSLWFHLDTSNDVLYLRRSDSRTAKIFGEESPEGFTLLRNEGGDLAGMTVVNYWSRFGARDISTASMRLIKNQLQEWATSNCKFIQ